MMKIKNIVHRAGVVIACLVLSQWACKKEKLVFPESSNSEVVVTQTRPTARPQNLTIVSAFNQQIEIFWPVLSDRVSRAILTYEEDGTQRQVEITNFEVPTVINVDLVGDYSFGATYFTSDNTASKLTTFTVHSLPFETDFKLQNMDVVLSPAGVTFYFPDTETEKTFTYVVKYMREDEAVEIRTEAVGAASIEAGGLPDEDREVEFTIEVFDQQLEKRAVASRVSKPGMLNYKRLVDFFQFQEVADQRYIFWSNPFEEPVTVTLYYLVHGEVLTKIYTETTTGHSLAFDLDDAPSLVAVEITGKEGFSTVAELTLQDASNIALGKRTQQSSTAFGGASERAVDGNTDGRWGNNSVTHTPGSGEDWWEVDLGAVSPGISTITLFNRTDCCGQRLGNFVIFISDQPFTGTSVAASLAQPGVLAIPYTGQVGANISIPVLRSGRYVRIQLRGNDPLSLAEVQVFGVQK
ncbi:galactose-binding domain-containing protein [Sphingobacterium griseoflavum]|uniref:F5/8 type C domain-containing protein n=1 Tax=Sphingobacterium griseoflavum TaxID=1474952 RepID=A0ABQ3HSR6_9SPHI|nr:discoidin domain-containing protein [Sphingobacterium griseoflavum]GHE23393.1 hypothetical protein GCM10017764_03610 [Sphingobacterium griseoflavum]